MKKQIELVFTEKELEIILDALYSYDIRCSSILSLRKKVQLIRKLYTKINKLIPKEWGWVS